MKNNGRVLAYNMASVIEQGDLKQVSGGASAAEKTHHQTVKASAAALGDVDVSFDVTVDW